MNNRLKLECDVLVIGGSLEGCITALEIAKSGRKVLLAEKHGSLGGMSTNGLNTYLPSQKLDNPKAKSYAELILKHAKEGESEDGSLYHDQRLKVVLEQMLSDAGVIVLKHIYLDRLYQSNPCINCIFGTKIDILEVEAKTVFDSTDTMNAAAYMNRRWKQQKNHVEISVKWNGILSSPLKDISTSLLEETKDTLIGITSIPLSYRMREHDFFTGELVYCHNKLFGETILTGFCTTLAELNDFTLSDSIAGLRIFAYKFRSHLTERYPGMQKAEIIQVAPVANCYGTRVFEADSDSRLFLLNNEQNNYSNCNAILSGIQAANTITQS